MLHRGEGRVLGASGDELGFSVCAQVWKHLRRGRAAQSSVADAEKGVIIGPEAGRQEHFTVVPKRHQAAIEESVEVCDEWEAVVGIEAFAVGGVLPRFDVGCTDSLAGHGGGDGATVVPELENLFAEDTLTNTGLNE